jgi:hypothetical protein
MSDVLLFILAFWIGYFYATFDNGDMKNPVEMPMYVKCAEMDTHLLEYNNEKFVCGNNQVFLIANLEGNKNG